MRESGKGRSRSQLNKLPLPPRRALMSSLVSSTDVDSEDEDEDAGGGVAPVPFSFSSRRRGGGGERKL